MKRIALVVLTALAAGTPAVSNHTPSGLLDRAQNQVHALDAEVDQVRNYHLRSQLEQRVDRIDRLLRRLEQTGALDQPDFRPPPRPHPRPHRPAFYSFQDAMVMIDQERFERDKLAVIQRSASRMRLTSQQARALVAELDFDNNRADALIALYPSITDKHRFFVTLDALDFRSNRRKVRQTLGV